MAFNESIGQLARLFIIIFLCSEMQSSVTKNSTFADRILYYNSKTNSTAASWHTAGHHASIRLKEQDQEFGEGHICSGVVIGPSVVLTTAHCVYNHHTHQPYHPSELSVVLASIDRYQRQEQTLVFGVTHSYQPDTFSVHHLKDNVAILMLEYDVPKANDFIKPITLPQAKQSTPAWYERRSENQFKVTTWLKTSEGLFLSQLMLLNASHVSGETCSQYYGEAVFNTGMLCIVSLESLSEDFGSPLFIENKLVGLRSFASGHLAPAIYTDVSHHENWIRSVVGDGSNQNSSVWGTIGLLLLTYVALSRTKFMKTYDS